MSVLGLSSCLALTGAGLMTANRNASASDAPTPPLAPVVSSPMTRGIAWLILVGSLFLALVGFGIERGLFSWPLVVAASFMASIFTLRVRPSWLITLNICAWLGLLISLF